MLSLTLILAALVHAVEAVKCDPLKHQKALHILVFKWDKEARKPKILRHPKTMQNPVMGIFEKCPEPDGDDKGKCNKGEETGFFCTKPDLKNEGQCLGRCIASEEEANKKSPHNKAGKASKREAALRAFKTVFGGADPDALALKLWDMSTESSASFKHFELEKEKEEEEGERRLGKKGKPKKREILSHPYWMNITTKLKEEWAEEIPWHDDLAEDFNNPDHTIWFICDATIKKDAEKIKKGNFEDVKRFKYADVFKIKRFAQEFQCPNMGGSGGKKSSSGSGVVVVIVILLLLLLAGAGAGMMMMQKNKPLMPPTSTAQLMESQQKTIEMSSR